MSDLKLELRNLGITYVSRQTGAQVEAVRDVNLTVADKPGTGEIIALLGPSGCGKSTILKAIAGLIAPTKGEVYVDGHSVDGPGRERGMIFQAYTSFAWLTACENVEYGLRLKGVSQKERRELAMEYLRLVGLADFADAYPKQLSGGMKQRVAIARTLINKPRLVLMDEPFGALDPQTRWEMQGLLLRLSHHEDNTTVLITHDVSEAVYVADKVYVLSHRPAQILYEVEIPFFGERGIGLQTTPKFLELEAQLLEALYNAPKVAS